MNENDGKNGKEWMNENGGKNEKELFSTPSYPLNIRSPRKLGRSSIEKKKNIVALQHKAAYT